MARIDIYKKVSTIEIPRHLLVEDYYVAVRNALDADQVDQIGDYVLVDRGDPGNLTYEEYRIWDRGVQGPL